eukprot:TRINITY_DN17419_c0_g1_i1.p1 TRINITY_DN17419_c0_g1~~TRINITY_DN17419_c0_g1_i1.p1  ORF type:complete len:227 (+),score=78.78 TRINITY_DN17419_c0_g1_i1:50-682(+)
MPSLQEWYRKVPPVTRWHMTLMVVTALTVHAGGVRPDHLGFTPHQALLRGQVWRLLTTFTFAGAPGLNLMLLLQTHYFMGVALEKDLAATVRHAWLYLLSAGILLAAASLIDVEVIFLSQCLHTTVMFFFSQYYPDAQLALMAIFIIPGSQLVWWALAFNLISGQPLAATLLGIAVGLGLYHSRIAEQPPALLQRAFLPESDASPPPTQG